MRPGESLLSFHKRVDKETREKLTSSWKETKKISQRKKNYYDRRKEKRAQLESQRKERLDTQKKNSEDPFASKSPYRDFSDLQDKVGFGEVAHEPPAIVPIFKKRKAYENALPTAIPQKKRKL